MTLSHTEASDVCGQEIWWSQLVLFWIQADRQIPES